MKHILFSKLKSQLLRPQPYSHIKSTFKFSLFVMLYVGVILFINFANISIFESRFEYIVTVLVFAVVVGIVPVLNSIILKYIIPKKIKMKWNLLGEIIIYQIHFISIGIVNNLIASQFFPVEDKISNLIINILITYVIGIFPVSFILIRRQNILIKKSSQNSVKEETNPVSEICFVESVGNYLEIVYKNKKTLRLRSTLKHFLEQSEEAKGLKRIHSGYAANLSMVVNVKGNSQGMSLTLNNIDKVLPVSRKYVHVIRSFC